MATKQKMNYPYNNEEKKIIKKIEQEITKTTNNKKTIIIGIQGGPGTGKTTLAKYLEEKLNKKGITTTTFSLDDFYKEWNKRKELRKKHPKNPFYQIPRIMPGTHKTRKLYETIKKLKQGKKTTIPIFDKSLKKGVGEAKEEKTIKEKNKIIIIEGWFIGCPEISVKELKKYYNNMKEENLEPISKALKQYQKTWKEIDKIIMLKPTNNELHLYWREEQEKQLKQKKGEGLPFKTIKKMINLSLPLTKACYKKINPWIKIKINKKHKLTKIIKNQNY